MNRILTLFVVLGLVAAAASVAQAANLLTNGSLDLTYPQLIIDNPDPQPDLFLPKPLNWVNEGTRTLTGAYEDEMSSEGFANAPATPQTAEGTGDPGPDGCGAVDCGVFFKPFSGNDTDGAATGTLYQDNAATAGTKYVLTGWAGAEANAMMADAVIAIDFLDSSNAVIGGNSLSLLPTLLVPNGNDFNYKEYSVSATAPVDTATVRARVAMIGALGNPAGGGQAFVVDDFSLSAVPEPATLSLVALGLISLIGIRRRSR